MLARILFPFFYKVLGIKCQKEPLLNNVLSVKNTSKAFLLYIYNYDPKKYDQN